MPRRLVAKHIYRLHDIFEAVQHGPQLRQHTFAGLGQGDAASRTIEKPDPQLLFKRANCLAEG